MSYFWRRLLGAAILIATMGMSTVWSVWTARADVAPDTSSVEEGR